MNLSERNERFVFISSCILCQAYQASGLAKFENHSSIRPVVELLLHHDINIIQMPCPESSYGGYIGSLVREPAGLKKYDCSYYRAHCNDLADTVVEQIVAIHKHEFLVSAIIGIENSPSCAVNYIYGNRGMVKRRGIYIGAIEDKLQLYDINPHYLGINRRHINPSLKRLDNLLSYGEKYSGNNV